MGWGAIAAPIIGQIAGSAIGSAMAGKPKNAGMDRRMYDARQAQIDQMGSDLAASRGRYQAALGNMYNSAFQRFIPAQEARLAARGLSMGGGAYGASLGREVARYQSELEPALYQAERSDIGSVDNARSSLFSSGFDAQNEAGMYNIKRSNDQRDQFVGMMGNLGSSLGSYAYAPGPTQNLNAPRGGSSAPPGGWAQGNDMGYHKPQSKWSW